VETNQETVKPVEREKLLEAFYREISRNSTWTVMFHHAVALRLGLNPTDLKCAGVLRETGAITAGELAELTGLTTGAITGVLDRLEQIGLVRRVRDANDRRRIFVELVQNAALDTQAAEVFGPLSEATATLLTRYADDELALLVDFVQRGAELMKEQTGRLRRIESAGR
jgi:DNA-binding MarR family transcriptional regulator